MVYRDDSLTIFARDGATLPEGGTPGTIEHDGARLWYTSFGEGRPVLFLHGGMGHSGNFAHQVPALVAAGYRPILLDSRGHGRSNRNGQPFGYKLLASDVLALLDHLGLERVPIVGWSDGACTGLVLAHDRPERVAGLFFFACNVDPSGTLPFEMTPVIQNCVDRHARDYVALSPTPERFGELGPALQPMQSSEPNYTASDLAAIACPVTVAHATGDEFIRREHAQYVARMIPGARFVLLEGVTHFAPLQRPDLFSAAVLAFLSGITSS
jgi:pimeloyl-ACP methyl ester carboxylesterase